MNRIFSVIGKAKPKYGRNTKKSSGSEMLKIRSKICQAIANSKKQELRSARHNSDAKNKMRKVHTL